MDLPEILLNTMLILGLDDQWLDGIQYVAAQLTYERVWLGKLVTAGCTCAEAAMIRDVSVHSRAYNAGQSPACAFTALCKLSRQVHITIATADIHGILTVCMMAAYYRTAAMLQAGNFTAEIIVSSA